MLVVDGDEQRSCSSILEASAVRSSSGITRIVRKGVATPELRQWCECHTLALVQVSGVQAATILLFRGANHTAMDSCTILYNTCSIAKVGHHTHCGCEVIKHFIELLYHVLPLANLVLCVSTQLMYRAYVFISLFNYVAVTCLPCFYRVTFADIVKT